MKKIILVGRSETGKTTLRQALKGETIHYHKTQYVNYFDVVIDTPGEYAQTASLGRALALYTYEADVCGLLLSAIEPYSLYPPCCTSSTNRECIGIVTKINHPRANTERAERWLRLAGCKKIFRVDSKTGEGIPEILEYLSEEGDVLPWLEDEKGKKRKKTTKTQEKTTKNNKNNT
ncbi:MAG: EutP/PduV family microcompartment system protein [Lachnospiraceae bacterium]